MANVQLDDESRNTSLRLLKEQKKDQEGSQWKNLRGKDWAC